MPPSRLSRLLLRLASLLCGLGAFACTALYATRYWPYRGLFEAGRYFDAASGVVYHEQTGLLLIPALLLLGLAGAFATAGWRRQTDRARRKK